jgi:hypothetical protein
MIEHFRILRPRRVEGYLAKRDPSPRQTGNENGGGDQGPHRLGPGGLPVHGNSHGSLLATFVREMNGSKPGYANRRRAPQSIPHFFLFLRDPAGGWLLFSAWFGIGLHVTPYLSLCSSFLWEEIVYLYPNHFLPGQGQACKFWPGRSSAAKMTHVGYRAS